MLPTWLRILALSIALWTGLGAAHALDQAQIDAIDRLAVAPTPRQSAIAMARHYAILLWVEDYCGGRSDADVRARIMSRTAGQEDAFEVGWASAWEVITVADRAALCALALIQYGPEGALIPRGFEPKP